MTSAQVCETVLATSMAELRRARDRADADLVELRLDAVRDLDVRGALEGRRLPVIVTCRAAWEGGYFTGAEEDRLRVLAEAIRLGAEYVDVEWRADRRGLPNSSQTQLVLSHHDFGGVPADLADRVAAMRRESGVIVKVAVTAHRLRDCLTLRAAMAPGLARQVAIAMGAPGQVTRAFPAAFGSAWTYGGTAAPGQFSPRDLIHSYRVRTATKETPLFAVTGWPLAHSASPAMHNAALDACGLDGVYVALPTADAEELLEVADALHVQGLSITAPLKTSLLAHAVTIDDRSRDIGAVNTFKRADRGWDARNFDPDGLLAPLDRHQVGLAGARAVVLGAGGAARTAVWAMRLRGAAVEVAARRPEAAARLAEEFGVAASPWPPAPGWDLLINTTPVGTWPGIAASPLSAEALGHDLRAGVAYDLVYNPAETAFLREAAQAGARTIGGLDMLVGQACRQFRWWTGYEAPEAAMTQAATLFIHELTAGSDTRQDHEANHV